ncbi:Protein RESTRICTED TEV MOVEMENT like [Actinidia chinensis var. chinensis]|uniref:Protein RESTRICTED TEV MOVEMENT like n=1 Tax=Actinidia chinensis var. chinensis TaxID=1590841 RepID=A0A2R6Q467_ACTCC|nr:Protein RESTRICTED TEV MOVEMENT like [Actinidia chinensis var. chinensis]
MEKNVAAATALPTDSKAGVATSELSYDDFEPFCKWKREEGQQTVVIHVPEFKREQMKVHVSNRRCLKITGERPLDNTKRSRFTKEIKIPKDCNANDITAKFTNAGLLYIIMPKKIASMERKQDQTTPVQQPRDKPNVAVIGGGLKAAMVVVLVVAVAVGVYATYKYKFSDSDVGASVSYASNM